MSYAAGKYLLNVCQILIEIAKILNKKTEKDQYGVFYFKWVQHKTRKILANSTVKSYEEANIGI